MQHTQPPRRRRDVGELRTISSDWTRTNHKWQLVKKPNNNNNNNLTFGRVERTNGAPEKKRKEKKEKKKKSMFEMTTEQRSPPRHPSLLPSSSRQPVLGPAARPTVPADVDGLPDGVLPAPPLDARARLAVLGEDEPRVAAGSEDVAVVVAHLRNGSRVLAGGSRRRRRTKKKRRSRRQRSDGAVGLAGRRGGGWRA